MHSLSHNWNNFIGTNSLNWSGIAVQSDDAEAFKANLAEYIAGHPEVDSEAGKQIRLLIEFDGQEVHELSIGEQLPISTLSMLHSFLTGQWEEETETDLFIDLFQQFKRLHQPAPALPSAQKIKTLTERWPSGLDEDVQHIRAKNKERILHALVQKIEHRKNPASRFHFEEGLSYEEKFNLVSEWWNDFRFHLAMAVKSPTELNRLLGNSLSAETMYLLSKARKKGMPFFATPYYLSLLNCTGSGYDDEALRSYILYSPQLVETYGQIRAWEREDIVEPGKPNAAGWLLPTGITSTAVIRKWPSSSPTPWDAPAEDSAHLVSVCTTFKANGSILSLTPCVPRKHGKRSCVG